MNHILLNRSDSFKGGVLCQTKVNKRKRLSLRKQGNYLYKKDIMPHHFRKLFSMRALVKAVFIIILPTKRIYFYRFCNMTLLSGKKIGKRKSKIIPRLENQSSVLPIITWSILTIQFCRCPRNFL